MSYNEAAMQHTFTTNRESYLYFVFFSSNFEIELGLIETKTITKVMALRMKTMKDHNYLSPGSITVNLALKLQSALAHL